MSTLLVNNIIRYNSEVLNLPGRVVTATHYVSTNYSVNTGQNVIIDSFNFNKKYSSQETMVWGLWSISNLREGSQAQYYTCERESQVLGEYKLRHANSGWSMALDAFSWKDTTAPKGSIIYNLKLKEYVGNFYYNYPTNLSGAPNANSTFLIMEITI